MDLEIILQLCLRDFVFLYIFGRYNGVHLMR